MQAIGSTVIPEFAAANIRDPGGARNVPTLLPRVPARGPKPLAGMTPGHRR